VTVTYNVTLLYIVDYLIVETLLSSLILLNIQVILVLVLGYKFMTKNTCCNNYYWEDDNVYSVINLGVRFV